MRRHAAKLVAAALLLLLLPLLLHFAIGFAARLTPPHVEPPRATLRGDAAGIRRYGDRSYARRRGKLLEVGLYGAPEQIGHAHAKLLYPEMVENEGILLGLFERMVKPKPVRTLLLDLAQLRFKDLDQGMDPARLREIAGGALGFQPDPYAHVFDTYQRFVYLNALYDISLSFEHSPLIGCTTFALAGPSTEGRKAYLARAFDFEADPVFDTGKAVFFVRETGKIPFASVAWPGLVGVVSGMNASGLAVVVHGARAGDIDTRAEPVVHSLRRVLASAHDADQAVRALRERPAMVSHIVVLTDAAGRSRVVERVPGQPNYMYTLGDRGVVTNHFKGPAAEDPKNDAVRRNTSTLARAQRGQQLVKRLRPRATVDDAVELLRDRRGVNDVELELGDRRAIDALIATHGVVLNATDGVLWVSESPHLLGRFVAYDLKRMLADDYDPAADTAALRIVPEDPLLTSGAYDRLPKRSFYDE